MIMCQLWLLPEFSNVIVLKYPAGELERLQH